MRSLRRFAGLHAPRTGDGLGGRDTRAPVQPLSRIDPTGTTPIRQEFRAAAERHLNRWKQLVRVSILAHDVFGHSELRAGQNLSVESIHAPSPRQFANLSADAKLRAFGLWMMNAWETTMQQPLWWEGYLRRALGKGLREAELDTKPTQRNYREVTALLNEQVGNEIRGIGGAVMMAVARLVADHIHHTVTPLSAYREINKVVTKIGLPRLTAMANTYTVKAYNRIKLAVYRHAGLTQVGIIPEHILMRNRQAHSTVDAAFDPWEFERRGEGDDQVNWLTAGDDDVCPICEDLADDSPYTLDEAEDLYPPHPNCRCAVVPLWDARFAR